MIIFIILLFLILILIFYNQDSFINSDNKYNKGLNNFDIIYYINLDHRTDRLKNITEQLLKTNIESSKINRISAPILESYKI